MLLGKGTRRVGRAARALKPERAVALVPGSLKAGAVGGRQAGGGARRRVAWLGVAVRIVPPGRVWVSAPVAGNVVRERVERLQRRCQTFARADQREAAVRKQEDERQRATRAVGTPQ